MRWFFALVVMCVSVREAAATCDGCCHLAVELLGWSKDGKTIVIQESLDTVPQKVLYKNNVEQARWGGAEGDCGIIVPKPAMPADTYAKHGIVKLDAAWRTAFKQRFTIRASQQPYKHGTATCTGTDVVDQDGKVVARWVRDCDPNETECISGTILGGYVHPSGKWLLMKTKTNACRLVSTQAYKLVPL